MTMLLLAVVAVVVIRFLVRRFASPKPQLAGANGANFRAAEPTWNAAPAAAAAGGAAAATAATAATDAAGGAG